MPAKKQISIKKKMRVSRLKGKGKKLMATISRLLTIKIIRQIRMAKTRIDLMMRQLDFKVFVIKF